jgi:hypothetical protein
VLAVVREGRLGGVEGGDLGDGDVPPALAVGGVDEGVAVDVDEGVVGDALAVASAAVRSATAFSVGCTSMTSTP